LERVVQKINQMLRNLEIRVLKNKIYLVTLNRIQDRTRQAPVNLVLRISPSQNLPHRKEVQPTLNPMSTVVMQIVRTLTTNSTTLVQGPYLVKKWTARPKILTSFAD
jgi:hypothetical protein